MNAPLAAKLAEHLSERDHAALLSLERFRLLTTPQLQRLHFHDHASHLAAARAAARSMRRLATLGVVAALERRIGGVRRGSASYVWQLTSSGERYLRATRGQARRRRYVEPGAVFVRHTLAVAEVAVALLEADRTVDGFTVEALVPEPANWRRYLGPAGETRWLKPDLYVITVTNGAGADEANAEYEEHAFVEIDLGTEHLPRIQTKCRTYAAYAATGAYQAAHGLFPAVVWLSPDSTRRAALSAAVAAVSGLPAEVFQVASPEEYLDAVQGGQAAGYREAHEQKGGTT